ENAIAKGPQHIFDSLRRQRGERGVVVGRFDDDLMRAYAVHLVEHSFGLLVEIAFDDQRGELVRDDAHRPTGRIPLRRATVRAGPVGHDFWRRLALVAVTKGTKSSPLDLDGFTQKIAGTLGAIGGDDDPTTHNRVFS